MGALLPASLADQYHVRIGLMHDVVFATAALFAAALGVLVLGLFARSALFDRSQTAHWKHNDEEVRLRRKRHGNFDAFLSQYASYDRWCPGIAHAVSPTTP